MIDLWKMRNEDVHGKEEVTKQQKRKTKEVISVSVSHKLKEIARRSDSMLFYQDVEKEKEQETAAKLERYITMKTRPIYHSVYKWADRAISGAKSVVDWIRTEQKKKREIVEKAEKRQQDHF